MAKDDALETALRAPEPAIADESFSERVIASLPRSRRRPPVPSRRWTLAAAAAAGSLLTILLAPTVESVVGFSLPFLHAEPLLTFAALLAVAAGPIVWLLRSD
jgi:anti-sigma factor RsiW